MKFQRIGTGQVFARMAILSLLLLAGAPLSYAVDEDIPPPADSEIPAPKSSLPSASAPNDSKVLNEDESIPAPSLGDDALPEPSVDRGQEKAHNQVNKAPEDDEIFLPTPNVNDNVYYAPVGTPAPRVSAEDLDWRVMGSNRPAFSLYTGVAFRSYANSLVTSQYSPGVQIAASYRVINLGQTLFLHAYYGFTAVSVGDVGADATGYRGVVDNTQQVGGMLELGIGRRMSLFGSLMRRWTYVRANPYTPQAPLYQPQNLSYLNDIGADPSWFLGAGFQWDFYVVPHGSIGMHVQVERDLYSLTLSWAMEPAPRKKLTLNYDDMGEN